MSTPEYKDLHVLLKNARSILHDLEEAHGKQVVDLHEAHKEKHQDARNKLLQIVTSFQRYTHERSTKDMGSVELRFVTYFQTVFRDELKQVLRSCNTCYTEFLL